MGFGVSAQADPFDLQEIARQGGILFQTTFDSIDFWDQSTSGSGALNTAFSTVFLQSGSTTDSHSRIELFRSDTVVPPTWNADRTVTFGIDFQDTDGPLFAGSGLITEDNYTQRHIGLKMNNGDLIGSVGNGTTETTTTLVSGASTGVRRADIRHTAGESVEFRVDGTLLGTVSTGLPSGTGSADKLLVLQAENSTATDRALETSEARMVQHP